MQGLHENAASAFQTRTQLLRAFPEYGFWPADCRLHLDCLHEWKGGAWYLKLDIAKAFDCLSRGKFLKRLTEKMGGCEELQRWWDLLENTEARLVTAWGSSTVRMHSGIRQGSVESPQVFATAMDWIVKDAAERWGWDPTRDVWEGLEFAESAFVDDCVLWNGRKKDLEAQAEQLIQELALWGLRVNPEKSQVYCSPYSKEAGALRVGQLEVEPDDRLDIMGVPFRSGISPKEALQPIFQKTKNKFWALKHHFRARTSIKGRMQLLQKVLGGTSLWCVSAFVPDQTALMAINVLQAQLTMWTLRLFRRAEEPWVEYRVRCFRQALKERWSTMWLRTCWAYCGHRARAVHWVPKPGTAILDKSRDLEWWEAQKQQKHGMRHPTRFFPRLMTDERNLNKAAGGDWRAVAQDKPAWEARVGVWIEQQDLPWASHQQLALEG